MLDLNLVELQREIDGAERFRDIHLSSWRDNVARFVGSSYRDGMLPSTMGDDPENFIHEYIALVLPRLVHDNPRVRVQSMRPAWQAMDGRKLELGINQWSKMVDVRDTIRRMAVDMLLSFGVGLVVSEPKHGHQSDTTEPYLPRVYRISPDRWFIDPAASCVSDARFMGHKYVTDKSDLITAAESDQSYDMEAIMRISTGINTGTTGSHRWNDIPDRQEMVVYEVWVPEVNQEGVDKKTHNGTIYTYAYGQAATGATPDAGWIRKPTAYFGPRTGPYALFGCYTVPDDPYPLSPLVAINSQLNDLNGHLKTMRESASRYKRMIVVDSRHSKMAQDIRDHEHDTVFLADNLEKDRVVPIEVGGVTPHMVQYSSIAQDRLDRVSGIHDAMRGNVQGTATATEVSVAESSATMRLADLKRQFTAAVDLCLNKVAWYMWHDERISLPLGKEGVKLLYESDPIYKGGAGVGSYDDLCISVDAYSMERVNEALTQRRGLELLQIVGNLGQSMVTMPWVKWDELINQVGDMLNIPNLGDMFDQSVAKQAGGGGGGGGGGGSMPQPQESNDPSGAPQATPASSVAGMRAAMNRGGLRQ